MFAADHPPGSLAQTSSRRAAVRHGALLATLGAMVLPRGVTAQATPGAMAGTDGAVLVQSFGRGSLFPTQGDAGVLPYTAILWEAADRGFLSLDPAGGSVGVASTNIVLSALGAAGESPRAVLLTLAGAGAAGAIWALRLRAGQLGSDPGAVTYQGEPVSGEDVLSWMGTAPPDLPDGPQELGAGYLIIAGLSGFDAT